MKRNIALSAMAILLVIGCGGSGGSESVNTSGCFVESKENAITQLKALGATTEGIPTNALEKTIARMVADATRPEILFTFENNASQKNEEKIVNSDAAVSAFSVDINAEDSCDSLLTQTKAVEDTLYDNTLISLDKVEASTLANGDRKVSFVQERGEKRYAEGTLTLISEESFVKKASTKEKLTEKTTIPLSLSEEGGKNYICLIPASDITKKGTYELSVGESVVDTFKGGVPDVNTTDTNTTVSDNNHTVETIPQITGPSKIEGEVGESIRFDLVIPRPYKDVNFSVGNNAKVTTGNALADIFYYKSTEAGDDNVTVSVSYDNGEIRELTIHVIVNELVQTTTTTPDTGTGNGHGGSRKNTL